MFRMQCRTKYFDDHVLASVAKGINQVVCLGIGGDTRAYRLNISVSQVSDYLWVFDMIFYIDHIKC